MKPKRAKVIIKGGLNNTDIQWGSGEFKDNVPELDGQILAFSGDHIQFLRDGNTQMLTIDTRIPWITVHIFEEDHTIP